MPPMLPGSSDAVELATASLPLRVVFGAQRDQALFYVATRLAS